MIIGIPSETRSGETRVAATPETIKKLLAGGKHVVLVQSGAGVAAAATDDAYRAAGAEVVDAAAALGAELVLKVRSPEAAELARKELEEKAKRDAERSKKSDDDKNKDPVKK